MSKLTARRVLVGVAFVGTFAAGVAASPLLRTHDPLLDSAVANLNGGITLLEAVEAPDLSGKALKEFNRHVNRASGMMQDTIDEIGKAIAVADGGK